MEPPPFPLFCEHINNFGIGRKLKVKLEIEAIFTVHYAPPPPIRIFTFFEKLQIPFFHLLDKIFLTCLPLPPPPNILHKHGSNTSISLCVVKRLPNIFVCLLKCFKQSLGAKIPHSLV